MPNEWLRKHKRDQYHRLAKARGFRSRASFKLLQIAKRYRFITPGQRLLDLGAAPGGWLQTARQLVGRNGFVLGIDTEPIERLQYENVATMVGDITEPSLIEQIKLRTGQSVDVILSDLSPNVSGVWELDHARQIELARCTLRFARSLLRPSGNVLVKVFQGSEVQAFRSEMRSMFRELRIVKPPASRQESAELYFLGLGFLGEVAE